MSRTAGLFILVVTACATVLPADTIPGRYLVELETEPVAEHVSLMPIRNRLLSPAAAAHRSRLRAEQQQIRTQLERRRAQVLASVDTLANALLVRVPDADAAQLAAVPGVKRVLPVRKLHLVLDRAVILHKVTDAWNRIGQDRAGAGVKVAIIDTGIEATHPGFQDLALAIPNTYPRVGAVADQAFTNHKIIVARSYVGLLPNRDPDASARDRVGHGTALAMIAAGVRSAGPLATITGVAPAAYLGNYKVFGTPGFNDDTAEDVVLKAMDDAVADGMDIISLSLGSDLAPRLTDDLSVQAVERAAQAGVIVVVAAGNNGPDLNTMSSPATAPSALAVGATTNDRTFAASVEIPGFDPIVALPGNNAAGAVPITAPLTDAASLGDALACSSLPSGSLANRIVLMLRGTCTFETKLTNAQAAGAAGALIYAAADSPDPVSIDAGSAALPVEMISYDDGVALQQRLAAQPSLVVTMRFTLESVPAVPNRLAGFSAAGPNVDAGIKPDLTAVGVNVYTAAETTDPAGEMFSSSGFVLVDGTSFSTPLVAGAAALLKGARPGLSVDQYRSLLINTAGTVENRSGQPPSVQQAGAGLLDVDAALRATVTASPASLSFGAGTSVQVGGVLTLTNISSTAEAFTITAAPAGDDPGPVIGAARLPSRSRAGSAFAGSTVELAAGASAGVPVTWTVAGLAAGAHEGFLTVHGLSSGTEIHVPYWFAVPSGTPARVTLLDSLTSARRGSLQRDAILFRITDLAGLNLVNIQPQVTVVSGGAAVSGLTSHDSDVPGVFGIDVRLGPSAGTNVFRIRAGEVSLDVSISGL